MCAHREPAYRREPWRCERGPGTCACASRSCEALRHSEEATDRTLILPLFVQMTDAEQNRVTTALAAALEEEQARRCR
jgi:dTDP-4-amino-4,6-dideoxygalactose transaminase